MKTKDEDILKMIVAEFPDRASDISSRYFNSSIFLEACEDYFICLKSIKKLESKKDREKNKEIKELKGLLADLREEILSKLIQEVKV